jgi:hypothetical protein
MRDERKKQEDNPPYIPPICLRLNGGKYEKRLPDEGQPLRDSVMDRLIDRNDAVIASCIGGSGE